MQRVLHRWPNLSPGVAAFTAVALADLVLAVDSVPAILAITTDTFIVFSATAFALLGLRALFFLVAGASLVGERRASATPDARRPESAG